MTDLLLDILPAWGLREPFSAVSHGFGALLALGATFFLVQRARERGLKGRTVGLFGTTVVLAFGASALFHAVDVSPGRLDIYGKVDHAAIFLVVAGTGTAIYSTLETRWADQLLAVTWGLTILAITTKLSIGSLGEWATAGLHLAVGWAASIGLLVLAFSGHWRRLRSFLIGALFFSVGAVVFATEGPVLWPGVIEGHEVFHVLVLVGEAFHFHFVYRYCTCPAAFCESQLEMATDASPSGLGARPPSPSGHGRT